ncbi:MAG: DUF2185 domain-containing protein, partial [Planctomycetota bacterium]
MAGKTFKIPKDRIIHFVFDGGGSWASDRILVDGRKVGFMKREEPSSPKDSGWRFFAGDSSQEDRVGSCGRSLVDVNVVANYDADILPLLYEEPGAAFARVKDGRLLPQGPLPPSPLLRLTGEWSARIPSCFQRRKEKEEQIFWGLARAVWISFRDAEKGESPAKRLDSIRRKAGPNAVERYEPAHPTLKRFAYLVFEN